MNNFTFHQNCLTNSKTQFPLWDSKGNDLYSNWEEHDKHFLRKLTQKVWGKSNEKFYRCSLPYDQIIFESQWFDFPKSFFKSDFLDVINPDEHEWEKNIGYKYFDQEGFIKLCWVCDELLRDGNLRNELGAHINPHIQPMSMLGKDIRVPIVIHPGGTRQVAIMLFTPPKIKSFFFNTRGKSSMEGFEDVEELNFWDIEEENYQTIICPDHGTFIPHPMKDSLTIAPKKIDYFKIIKNNLKELNFTSNKPFPNHTLLPKNVNGNLKLELTIKKHSLNELDVLRVFVLICLGRELETDSFSLKLRGKV